MLNLPFQEGTGGPGTGGSGLYTSGSVIFANSSGNFTEDNAKLFWDDTNFRLGIETASPSATLHVAQTAKAGATAPTAILVVGGAHTLAVNEVNDAYFNFGRTVQYDGTALLPTTFRAVLIDAPTYAVSGGGGTLTTSSTVSITAAPGVGTGATASRIEALAVGGAVTIGATSAALVYSAIRVPSHTVTVTGTTAVTGIPGVAGALLSQVTVTDSSAATFTHAAGLAVDAPTVAGSVVFTNTSGLLTSMSGVTIASAASATYSALRALAHTLTVTGTTGMTAAPSVATLFVGQTTMTDSSAMTVTTAVGGWVDAPLASGSVTVTNTYGIVVGSAGTTIVSATSALYNAVRVPAATVTVTGTTAMTSAPSIAGLFVGQTTVTDSSAVTLTAVAGIFVDPPTAAGSATITNTYGIAFASTGPSIVSATSALYATIAVLGHTATVTGTTNITTATSAFSDVFLGTVTLTDTQAVTITNASSLYVASAPATSGASLLLTNVRAIQAGGSFTYNHSGATSTYYTLAVPAHTVTYNQTANNITSTPGVAAAFIGQITLAGGGGQLTMTNAASLYIADAPAAGVWTITNNYAVWVDAGNARFDGTVRGAAGTSALPEFTFDGDPDTGMYNISANTIGFAVGGTLRLDLDSTGAGYVASSGGFLASASSGFRVTSGAGILNETIGTAVFLQSGATQLQFYTDLAAGSAGTRIFGRSNTQPTAGNYFGIGYGASTMVLTLDYAGQLVNTVPASASVASATGATWFSHSFTAGTITITGTTAMTATPAIAVFQAGQVTVTDTSAVTISTTTGLFVDAPLPAGSVTITTNSAILAGNAGTTVVSATGAVYNAVRVPAATVTVTGTAAMTTVPSVAGLFIGTQTVTDASAVTITTVAGAFINPPTAGGSVTITNTHGLVVGTAGPTVVSATAAAYNAIRVPAATVTVTGTAAMTTVPGVAGVYIGQQTITDLSAVTITAGVGLFVDAPTVASSAVLTNTLAIAIGNAAVTVASATTAQYAAFYMLAKTVTLSGTTQMTNPGSVAGIWLDQITVTDASAITVDVVASIYVKGAPIQAGSVTLSKTYSLFLDAGLPRIDSTTANGTVATVLGSVGPTGANTTVQEWLTIDINGTTRYIPCF